MHFPTTISPLSLHVWSLIPTCAPGRHCSVNEHTSVGPAGVHVSGLRIQKAVPRLREKVNCEEVHSPSGAGYIPNLIIVTYPRANTCLTKTTLLQETRSVLRNPSGGKALFAETAVAPRVQSQFPGTRCLS